MKSFLSIILLVFFNSSIFSQQKINKKDSIAVIDVLYKQQSDWNSGDIDSFMEGYLKSENLIFSGSNGPIYGWEATRNRYKKIIQILKKWAN